MPMSTGINAGLRDELIAMFAADQELAVALFRVTKDRPGARDSFVFEWPARDRPAEYWALARLAKVHLARLVEITTEHGWPGVDLVGEDGTAAAWGIAQHADEDNEVCKGLLVHLEAAVREGRAPAEHLAALTDRICLRGGTPQIYGTLVRVEGRRWVTREPIEDRDGLDARRQGIGLGTWADWIASMPSVEDWYKAGQ